jgi:hypothetical protein
MLGAGLVLLACAGGSSLVEEPSGARDTRPGTAVDDSAGADGPGDADNGTATVDGDVEAAPGVPLRLLMYYEGICALYDDSGLRCWRRARATSGQDVITWEERFEVVAPEDTCAGDCRGGTWYRANDPFHVDHAGGYTWLLSPERVADGFPPGVQPVRPGCWLDSANLYACRSSYNPHYGEVFSVPTLDIVDQSIEFPGIPYASMGAFFVHGDEVLYANPIVELTDPPRTDVFYGHISDLAALHLARGGSHAKRYISCSCSVGGELMAPEPDCPPKEESCPTIWLHGNMLGVPGTYSACAQLTTGALQCFDLTQWWEELQKQREEARPPAEPGPAIEYFRHDGSAVGEVTKLAIGARHGCWLDPDHTVWCFGANDLGQLGQNTNDDELHTYAVAVPVQGEVVDIEALSDLTCALAVDGTVTCWGKTLFLLYPTPPFELSSIGAGD